MSREDAETQREEFGRGEAGFTADVAYCVAGKVNSTDKPLPGDRIGPAGHQTLAVFHSFVSLLENARPSFVIDIRIVPRFDVGRLNRERAFGLFEMTEAEIRHWNEWLLAEGINPKPIRQDRPPGSSSYGWDPVLPATLEYAGGVRYFVGIADRKIARLAPVGAVPEIPVPFQAASRRSARLSAC